MEEVNRTMRGQKRAKPSMSFFHDHRFVYDEDDKFYADKGFTNTLFKRYLRSFDSINVVARKISVRPNYDISKYSRINLDAVTFNCVEKLSIFSLFIGRDRQLIKDSIIKSDITLIRMPSIIGIVASVEARRQDKPYAIELVGCPWDSLWYYGKLSYKFIAPFLFLINRLLIYISPNVIYVSKNFLQGRYPTLGNSVACSDVEINIPDKTTLQDRLNKIQEYGRNKKYTLGTVGAVHLRYKGQHYVIKAINKLVKKGYDLEYYIVGNGNQEYLARLASKYRVADRVYFMGPMDHQHIKKFMSNLDIYVQPSNAESHGRVILEAFETACPVIGSSTGGIPELVSKEFVFKRKDVNDLTYKIEHMLDKNVLIQQAKRNFAEITKYNPKNLNIVRQRFYNDIVTRGRDD